MKTYKNVNYIGNNYKICDGYNFYSVPGKKLILHENTKVISAGAFFGCKEIENIIFPENLEKINEDAFAETVINKLNIKNKIKIKRKCFYHSNITDCFINVETVPNECFAKSYLQNIKLENTISISADAFYGAEIRTLALPSCLKSIGSRAFYDAILPDNTFIVPANVTSILDYALYAKNVDTIYLPYNLKTLDPCFAKHDCTIVVDKDTYNRFPCLKHYNVKFTTLDNLIEENKSFKEINKFYNENKFER